MSEAVHTIEKATTKSIMDTFKQELFSRFRYPRVFLSDNIPQFVSKAIRDALRRWEVEE